MLRHCRLDVLKCPVIVMQICLFYNNNEESMRRFVFVLLFLTLICQYTYAAAQSQMAEDGAAIYLDSSDLTPKFKIPEHERIINNQKYNLKTQPKNEITPLNVYDYKDKDDPYQQHSASFMHEKKYGKFAIGSKSTHKITPDKYSQTNTYYAKYNKDKFSFDTSLKNNGLTSFDAYRNMALSFTPEYKLNNHVTLQNIYTTNFLERNKKNEFVFSLKPFKDDRMNFDIGAGQVYSENTRPVSSQLNFSTKFKF